MKAGEDVGTILDYIVTISSGCGWDSIYALPPLVHHDHVQFQKHSDIMSLPAKLPISRIEDYHTHHLGATTDGRLFWGYETIAITSPYLEIQGDDWQRFRRELAVLHTFDGDGNFIETKHWTNDTLDTALTLAKLEEFVAELGGVEYRDIQVRLFQTTIDGIVFGLVPDAENETIELQPSSTIAFHSPWDGEYDT